jgi:phage shock protein E
MKTWKFLLFAAAVALAACDSKQSEPAEPGVTGEVSAPAAFSVVRGDQARVLVDKGAKLLDVRTLGEFDSGHIDGAVNIPVQELQNRLSELDKVQPVVVYCASGKRSSAAMTMMKDGGFAQVYDLGGKSNW